MFLGSPQSSSPLNATTLLNRLQLLVQIAIASLCFPQNCNITKANNYIYICIKHSYNNPYTVRINNCRKNVRQWERVEWNVLLKYYVSHKNCKCLRYNTRGKLWTAVRVHRWIAHTVLSHVCIWLYMYSCSLGQTGHRTVPCC